MGMDVHGIHPDAEIGSYLRLSMSAWSVLARCICDLAPVETYACKYWFSNDRDGLDAEGSIALANRLDHCIAVGAVDHYLAERSAGPCRLVRVKCPVCQGTGIRDDAVGRMEGFSEWIVPDDDEDNPRAGQRGWCNRCDGRGSVVHDKEDFAFGVSDMLREFSEFLRHSGGFRIC